MVLRSNDGSFFVVDRAVAMQSETIKSLIEHDRDTGVVHVNATRGSLAKVVDYLGLQEMLGTAKAMANIMRRRGFARFARADDVEEVMELAVAANYHDCQGLISVTRKLVENIPPMDAADYFGVRFTSFPG